MKFLALLLLGFSALSFAQTPTTLSAKDNPPAAAQSAATSANPNSEAIGNSEIHSAIVMSLQDHAISGVDAQVTDNEIVASGKVRNKIEKQMAHDIIAAYADNRKFQDHIKD